MKTASFPCNIPTVLTAHPQASVSCTILITCTATTATSLNVTTITNIVRIVSVLIISLLSQKIIYNFIE
jgi:hypothetical protein